MTLYMYKQKNKHNTVTLNNHDFCSLLRGVALLSPPATLDWLFREPFNLCFDGDAVGIEKQGTPRVSEISKQRPIQVNVMLIML